MSNAQKLATVQKNNVSGVGLKTVFNILDRWGCTPEQVQKILQISRPAYYKYRKAPEQASLTHDQIERLSYLVNIHGCLRMIFENPKNVYGFMALKNDNPYFNGKSPLEIISTGQFAALYETFRRIDVLRGGALVSQELPPTITPESITGFRLINSRFPPISLFDDVADEDEFDALYELQALTNPRLQTELGNLNLIRKAEIPFGIPGCSYATGPFTHVNPEGSRFSDGQYGVLYMGESIDTAIAEVAYHQSRYWQGVHGLDYDRLVFRGLKCKVGTMTLHDATTLSFGDTIYDADSYAASRSYGRRLYRAGSEGLRYHSVRKPGDTCWGLFTPRHVRSVIQTAHFEFIWNGEQISTVNKFTKA